MPKDRRSGRSGLPTWRVRLLGGFTALALVVAAVAALIAIKGNPTPHDVAFVPKRSPSAAGSGSTQPAKAKPTHSGQPAAGGSAQGSASASAGPATPSASPTASADVTKVPVTVLNNSTVSGLATRTAQQFQAAGWPIAAIGNLQGSTPATTVYYAPGEQAAAQELAREFPGISDVEPRYPGLPGADLTVVLTGDYQ